MRQAKKILQMVPIFGRIEEHLKKKRLTEALRETQVLLTHEPNDFYAQALEKKLRILIDALKEEAQHPQEHHVPVEQAIEALRRLCNNAGKRIIRTVNVQSNKDVTIFQMNERLQEMALDLQYLSILSRAHQHTYLQEYDLAVQEVERALLVRPRSRDAKVLLEYLQEQTSMPKARRESPLRIVETKMPRSGIQSA